VLERAGLVTKTRRGRERLVRADVEQLRAAARVLDRLEAVWRDRIEGMDAVLAGSDSDLDLDP
jgi:DNA-binding transcriptional ArsR family regulator